MSNRIYIVNKFVDNSGQEMKGRQFMQKEKRKRGRPVVLKMPELIPDTPENIARAVITSPPVPKGGWKYMKPEKSKACSK